MFERCKSEGCEPKWRHHVAFAGCNLDEFDFNKGWIGDVNVVQTKRTLKWVNPGTTNQCSSNRDMCHSWHFRQHFVTVGSSYIGDFTIMDRTRTEYLTLMD